MIEQPRVFHRGTDFSVLVKPAGMSSELNLHDPNADDPSLLAWVGKHLAIPDARLPHRLDRITRGLVVVAHDAAAAKRLGADLAAGRWEKHYLARVRANATQVERLVGTHTLHLKRIGRRAEIVRSGGQRAVTEILATAAAPDHPNESHLLLKLHTGRFHQIRATLAHLGVAVTDDPLYDPSTLGDAPPYMEHVVLRAALDGDERTFFDPTDSEREPTGAAITDAIGRVVEGTVDRRPTVG